VSASFETCHVCQPHVPDVPLQIAAAMHCQQQCFKAMFMHPVAEWLLNTIHLTTCAWLAAWLRPCVFFPCVFLSIFCRDERWSYSIVQRTWLLVLVVGVVFSSGDVMLQLFVYEAVLMASLICLIVFNPVASQVAGRLDIFVTLVALLNGFAAVFCVASTTEDSTLTGNSFGMGSSGRIALGVIVVVANVVVLLCVIAFIIKVHVATSPRVGKAVNKILTWGACLKP
jgi:hypothetical protein